MQTKNHVVSNRIGRLPYNHPYRSALPYITRLHMTYAHCLMLYTVSVLLRCHLHGCHGDRLLWQIISMALFESPAAFSTHPCSPGKVRRHLACKVWLRVCQGFIRFWSTGFPDIICILAILV